MRRSRALRVLGALASLPPAQRRAVAADLPPAAGGAIAQSFWALAGQREPKGLWRVWAIVAGRGFGKTRTGAEWVWARARESANARIALVAATLDEVRRVMVEGESGLLACARAGEAPRWFSTRGELHFPSGAIAFAYSAARPDMLRGPQHHLAWCDELAKWHRADATWDNLMLGLRLGARPRTLVTTTPRPVPTLKRLLAMPGCISTGGPTDSNRYLAPEVRSNLRALYGATRLGRQELDGILLDDLPGALWTRDMIEAARIPLPGREGLDVGAAGGGSGAAGESLAPLAYPPPAPPFQGGDYFTPSPSAPPRLCANPLNLTRTVVGVDPPASAHGDSCGIIVCGLGHDGFAYVLADLTVSGERPEGWARRVAAAAEAWDAQKVVAEKNQGGDMVESVLRAAAFGLPVKLVAATKGKAARAEPIALHFEAGRAKLAGTFPELEDQLCGLTYAGYEGPGNSPDRADAMVWAMTELFAKGRAGPRISSL